MQYLAGGLIVVLGIYLNVASKNRIDLKLLYYGRLYATAWFPKGIFAKHGKLATATHVWKNQGPSPCISCNWKYWRILTSGLLIYLPSIFPKGQLILKCPFGVFKSSKKTNEIFSRISALASKKRSNKKNKGTLY